MTESVSDILLARQRLFDSASRPIAASLGVHVLLVIALAVLPAAWFRSKPDLPTMTISLGAGTDGPVRKGELATGGRKVDTVVPPQKREPILPVAPPKALVPDPLAPATKTPPKTAAKPAPPPPITPTTKPATGAQLSKGSALVETGAKGTDIGLSSGGGGTNSPEMDFCCKEYFSQLKERVDEGWMRNQGLAGLVVVEFTIDRSGTVGDVKVTKHSGSDLLDFAAQRAVLSLQGRMGPLPAEYTGQRMIISLTFPYNR